ARVHRSGVEVDRLDALETLGLVKLVECDLEIALQTAGRGHVAAVALVAQTDVPERLALRGEGRVCPGELRAEALALVDLAGRFAGLLGRFRRRLGRIAGKSGEAKAAGRLHRLVFLGRDFDVVLPDPGQTKDVLGRRFLVGLGQEWANQPA